MEDFQERVVVERDELGEKINKLHAFRQTDEYKALDVMERRMLSDQLIAMRTYSGILAERIKYFDKPEAEEVEEEVEEVVDDVVKGNGKDQKPGNVKTDPAKRKFGLL